MRSDSEPRQNGNSRDFENARAYTTAVGMLSRRGWVAAQEVADRLRDSGIQRDLRWVQYLLKHLVEVEDTVDRDDSQKPYLYRWRQDVAHPLNPELSDREALTLLLASAHLRPLLPQTVLSWMSDRFEDARHRLDPRHGARPFNSWPEKVAVVSQLPPMMPPAIEDAVFSSVSEALLNDRWLNVDYRNAAGARLDNRRVMPLALVRQAERLFLVCRFDGYEDVRNLALHRIQTAQVTPHPFERPRDFDLQTYIDSGGFGFGNGERIVLEMRVVPHVADLLAETPLSADQSITLSADGSFRVQASVLRSEQIRWWIRMQGDAVHVLAPTNLLDEVDSSKPASTPRNQSPPRTTANEP